MSAKTKIVVLHMKELIYTAVFAALGILFIVLLITLFLPGKKGENKNQPSQTEQSSGEAAVHTNADALYIPGIYTTELVLGGQTIDVEVIVSENAITSIRLVNLNESVTTMYPLLQPSLDSICQQVYDNQSLDQISYTDESKYTSLVLLEAIQNSLKKASPAIPENDPSK